MALNILLVNPEIPQNIRTEKVISDETEELLKKAIAEFKK